MEGRKGEFLCQSILFLSSFAVLSLNGFFFESRMFWSALRIFFFQLSSRFVLVVGWSGGAMVLIKFQC